MPTSLSKVPEATLGFWVIKLLTTGMGETTSDSLVHAIDPAVAVVGAGAIFLVALAVQFFGKTFDRWRYWAAVTMMSVFGTMVADVTHIVLGVPYEASTIVFGCALAVIFVCWFLSERTLSIHSITTPRREAFYWATILATFALGTAVGDMTATSLRLGYLTSGELFLVLFALPALAYLATGKFPIALFWTAYILTRPVGASFADWMGVSHERGGLNWGTVPVSLVLLVAINLLVALGAKSALPRSDAAAGGDRAM